MESEELNFEEYRALIRAIKNIEIFGYRSFDDDSEPLFASELNHDLGYESGNESDNEILNESDNNNNDNDTSTLDSNHASQDNLKSEAKSDEIIDI